MKPPPAAARRSKRGLTDVMFRRALDNGEVYALILDYAEHASGCDCAAYAHVGQHSEANLRLCLESSRPAPLTRGTDAWRLYLELQQIGYQPHVLRRSPAWGNR